MKRLDLDASRAKAKKAQQDGGEKLQAVSGNLNLAVCFEALDYDCVYSDCAMVQYHSSLIVKQQKAGWGEGLRTWLTLLQRNHNSVSLSYVYSSIVHNGIAQDYVIVRAIWSNIEIRQL